MKEEGCQNVLPVLRTGLVTFSSPLSLSVSRATATYRGQIIFKDALAQQLCEQGGEWGFRGGRTQISTLMSRLQRMHPAPG